MFEAWGTVVYRRRWVVIAAVLAVTVLGGLWGTGVFAKLSQGGYTDPASESTQAENLANSTFGNRAGDVVVLYTAAQGHTVDQSSAAALQMLHALPTSAVRSETSYWETRSPLLVTQDHQRALVTITLNADSDSASQQRAAYVVLLLLLAHPPQPVRAIPAQTRPIRPTTGFLPIAIPFPRKS